MQQDARDALPDIIPAMRYRDAPAAIEWLAKAFGFEKHLVVPGPNGTIAHAELRLGNGLIMLGSARDDDFRWEPPRKGEVVTQSVYVVVVDPDAHHERAKAAGAEIVRGLQDMDYGSREYSARDPGGHLWHSAPTGRARRAEGATAGIAAGERDALRIAAVGRDQARPSERS